MYRHYPFKILSNLTSSRAEHRTKHCYEHFHEHSSERSSCLGRLKEYSTRRHQTLKKKS
jgi:hypothetical protein